MVWWTFIYCLSIVKLCFFLLYQPIAFIKDTSYVEFKTDLISISVRSARFRQKEASTYTDTCTVRISNVRNQIITKKKKKQWKFKKENKIRTDTFGCWFGFILVDFYVFKFFNLVLMKVIFETRIMRIAVDMVYSFLYNHGRAVLIR